MCCMWTTRKAMSIVVALMLVVSSFPDFPKPGNQNPESKLDTVCKGVTYFGIFGNLQQVVFR